MGRSPISDHESGVKKGPWTPDEDDKLIKFIDQNGHGSWRALPKLAGLNRCGKSCRLRWTNYLRPDIKRGKFSQEEEQTILNLHSILGNKWSAIATHLPGRTDNEIKNFWNTHLKKKLIQMGFDPMTHRPRTDIFSSLPHLIALANLIENPGSWEVQATRLHNEAMQMARLNQCLQNLIQPSFPDHMAANFNLLKDASILTHLEAAAPPPTFPAMQFLGEFEHLPDLQAPCSNMVQGLGFGGGDNSPAASSSPWMQPTISHSPPSAAAPVTETSISNILDACSSSSYGGAAQMWSELLDDPIFQEIA